jgi:hypothetical protein
MTVKELVKQIQLDVEWHSPKGIKITHNQTQEHHSPTNVHTPNTTRKNSGPTREWIGTQHSQIHQGH